MTVMKWVTSGESMVLVRERVMAADMPSVARTTRTLLAEQVEKGFVSSELPCQVHRFHAACLQVDVGTSL